MMNKMYGQQGMGPEMADAILRNADARTGRSIPNRNPATNQPVQEVDEERYMSALMEIGGDPAFRRLVQEEELKQADRGVGPDRRTHLAIHAALQRMIGAPDQYRAPAGSRSSRAYGISPSERASAGASARLTQRGYNAP